MVQKGHQRLKYLRQYSWKISRLFPGREMCLNIFPVSCVVQAVPFCYTISLRIVAGGRGGGVDQVGQRNEGVQS